MPRTVECELTEDLVDACIPGDVVTVTGIIRVINNYMDIGGGKEIPLTLYVTSTSSFYIKQLLGHIYMFQYILDTLLLDSRNMMQLNLDFFCLPLLF